MQITAAAGPTENRITTGIRYANAGMICAASRNGVSRRWKPGDRPATIPIGIPITSDSATAASMSASVCTLSSHSPISAKETHAATTISAGRRPPKRHTSSADPASVPTQVSHSSASVSAVTSQSASTRKPSKIAKTMFGSAAVRSSSSQSWRSSSLSGSWLQVSDAGHG